MAEAEYYLYLPDDCWERVFKFINDDGDDYDHNRNLKSISVVSKQFFSISNRLRFAGHAYAECTCWMKMKGVDLGEGMVGAWKA